MKILCEKIAMKSWHNVYNAVNTAYNNVIEIIEFFLQILSNHYNKVKKTVLGKLWMNTGLKNSCKKKKTTSWCIFEK